MVQKSRESTKRFSVLHGSLFSLGERDTPPDYQEAGCLLAAKSATAGSTGFLASWGNEKETNNGNMFLMHLVFIT